MSEEYKQAFLVMTSGVSGKHVVITVSTCSLALASAGPEGVSLRLYGKGVDLYTGEIGERHPWIADLLARFEHETPVQTVDEYMTELLITPSLESLRILVDQLMTQYTAPGVAPEDLEDAAIAAIDHNVRHLMTEVKANLAANAVREQEAAR